MNFEFKMKKNAGGEIDSTELNNKEVEFITPNRCLNPEIDSGRGANRLRSPSPMSIFEKSRATPLPLRQWWPSWCKESNWRETWTSQKLDREGCSEIERERAHRRFVNSGTIIAGYRTTKSMEKSPAAMAYRMACCIVAERGWSPVEREGRGWKRGRWRKSCWNSKSLAQTVKMGTICVGPG